jgi:dTMP kinase
MGRLITVEGIDGAGKTTLAGSLVEFLAERHGVDARLLREPGGVVLSERIRDLLKDPEMTIGGRAEALLYAAARAELIEQEVTPLLCSGSWVLLDRYVDSSLAYQGVARGLGVDDVAAINRFATGGLIPDRTLLLEIDPAAARQRADSRGEAPDRLEAEDDSFFTEIAEAYSRFAEAEPERFRLLDANLAPGELLLAAADAVADLVVQSESAR